MALKLYSDTDIQNIANAIRGKNGSSNTYKVSQMASAITAIPTGGVTPTGTKQISITQNGTTTEDVTNYASAEITVNVAGGGGTGGVTQDADGYLVLSPDAGSSGISIDDIATNSAPSGAITLSNDVTSIGDYAFAYKPITNIVAPNVTSFGMYSFYESNIEHVTDTNFPALPYGYGWAMRSKKLKSVEITKAVKLSNGSGGMRDCILLESVRFPNAQAVGLGNSFFNGCHALEVADIGNSTLGTAAFSNCYNLTKLVLRNTTLVNLGSTAILSNTPLRGYNSKTGTVYVPQALISSYQAASNWSSLYSAGTCNFVAIEGSEFEL